MNGTWLVRAEGAQTASALRSPAEVLAGLRDGIFTTTDEVKGPDDREWVAIETHPVFAEAAEDIAELPEEPHDETHLDMNPLIDVCLVLLIFFILTITYDSLRRSIDIPHDNNEEKGTPIPKVDLNEMKDKIFRVTAKMDGDKVVIKVEDKVTPLEGLQAEIERVIKSTGRREMFLDVDGNVPWGTQTGILDAAKGARVTNILSRVK